jgi:hypothetical protein
MAIKSVYVRSVCCICDGRGCHDCSNKGYEEEWIPFIDLVNEMKRTIEKQVGIR